VHGLAIRRGEAGKGLGRRLLSWAEDRAGPAGKRCLRLDCTAPNQALNAYYKRAGFRPRGWRTDWGLEVCLYEKEEGNGGAEWGHAPAILFYRCCWTP
jgi:GNAT superfamily N-acetyltransferase